MALKSAICKSGNCFVSHSNLISFRSQEDVYLSLPALLGRQGLLSVMEQEMTDKERAMVQTSAKGLADVIAGLDNLP